MSRSLHLFIPHCWSLLALLVTSASIAQDTPLDALSLEQLTNVHVEHTTAEPNDTQVAGARFVLTQDDIRRSGAISIPQALRLVPGLQVAQVDDSRWAISARGFNSRMSNRILVLIDGRSLYTPLSGGMYWNVQDTMIEEIDRIEVLLGPGGATWGANAFNGVINIVTKRASQTGGFVASTEVATDASKMAAMRLGDAEGDFKWRAFAKYSDGDSNQDQRGTTLNDDWEQARIGGRAQFDFSDASSLQLNFEAYKGELGASAYDTNSLVRELTIPWPSTRFVDIEEKASGGFAGARFTHDFTGGTRLNADASMQYWDLDSALMDAHGTNGELNLQVLAPRIGRHQIVSGVMARASEDTVGPGAWRLSMPEVSTWRASAFVQDEVRFFDDRLALTAGAKLEYSEITGSDFMPSLRALYTFDADSSIWAAASRAVRAPALTEHFGRLGGGPQLAPFAPGNPTPLPVRGELWGDENMDTEKVTAFELGVRHRFTPSLTADLALYFNRYEGLRGPGDVLPILCEPSGVAVAANPLCLFTSTSLLAPFELTNVYDSDAIGGELVVTYAPLSNWKLMGSYARIDHRQQNVELQLAGGADGSSELGSTDPRHQLAFRSSLALGRSWDLDTNVRYVDELDLGAVPSYVEMDARVAWRATRHFELALSGTNLLDSRHQEFSSDFGEIVPVWIERKVSLQARWLY